MLFGDVMMQMLYRCRPYEATPGAANALYEEYMARARKLAPKFNRHNYTKLCREAIRAFDTMPLVGEGAKPRVGVVGEILVKFHPTANNHVVDVIEREGCEAVGAGPARFLPVLHEQCRAAKRRAGKLCHGGALACRHSLAGGLDAYAGGGDARKVPPL